MGLQNLRWQVVVLAMAATLAVLFGAGFLIKSQTVEEPLKVLYGGSPHVEEYQVAQQGDGYVINVTLKETPDLATIYVQLNDETKQILRSRPFQLKLADRRTPELEREMRRLDLYVHEALATGHFAAMAERIESEAAKSGLSAKMAVDNERVYMQLHTVNSGGAYLFNVTERGRPAQPPRSEGGIGL